MTDSSGRYADIWQAIPLPMMILDGRDHIIMVNSALENMVSLSNRALIRRDLWSLIAADPALAHRLSALRETHAPLVMRAHPIEIGTQRFTANLRLALTETQGPDRDEALLIIEPTSRLTGEPSQAARTAIGLADMLAHEIKNPLAGIKGAAQLLGMELSGQRSQTGEDMTELTDLIVWETRRIVTLLEHVGQFGHQKAPAPVAINMHDILDRAKRSAELSIANHMTLVEEYDPSLPPALADPDQLQQVVLNLLHNAAQAGSPGGQITLRTFYNAGLRRQISGRDVVLPLHIEIIDNGPGLPAEIADQAFDPFVSGREAGTGLGLALASQLMLANDGWIEIQSIPSKTTVRLSLQRA